MKTALLTAIIAVVLSQPVVAEGGSSSKTIKMACTLLEQGRNGQALVLLNSLIKSEPGNALAYAERGHAYIHFEKYQKAVEDCTRALEISPRCARAYSMRADAYGDLGQYQKEINDLTALIEIDRSRANAYASRAHVYYDLGQLKMAVDDCTAAIALKPNSNGALETAAASYEELGLYDKALVMRTKILQS
ncbi:MAG: tetratricopeptide repeat protein, partial [Cyanobacteria bacterium REEB67]|nr:tetratricopeptide repeat protein [Cyanobacteria bacterium REEB67]